jgi:hypothetical protein
MAVLVTDVPAVLLAVDRLTGRELWSFPLKAHPLEVALLNEDEILLSSSEGIVLHSLIDGTATRTIVDATGGTRDLMHVAPDAIRFIDRHHRLVEHQTATGLLLRRSQPIDKIQLSVVGANRILCSQDRRMLSFPRSDSALDPEVWIEIEGQGPIQALPMLHNHRVYAGVAGKGLVCFGDEGSP